MNLRPVAMALAALALPVTFVSILLPLRRVWPDVAWTLPLPVAAPSSAPAPEVSVSPTVVWLTTPTPRIVEVQVQVTVEVPVEVPVTVVVPAYVYVPVTVTPASGSRLIPGASTPLSVVSEQTRSQSAAAGRTSTTTNAVSRPASVQSLSQPNSVSRLGSARIAPVNTTATQTQDVPAEQLLSLQRSPVSPRSPVTSGR